MNTIQRWRPTKGDINKIKMEVSDSGKYVLYASYLDECEKLRVEVERLRAENAAQASALVKSKNAMSSLVEWDASRNYIVPYKVRDPIHFALAAIEALPAATDGWRSCRQGAGLLV